MSSMDVIDVALGTTVTHRFTVTASDMVLFRQTTGDQSLIHTDQDFCKRHGFREPIVYGGIVLGHLSTLLGTMLPGKTGISTGWSIQYRKPLYVGDEVEMTATVAHFSPATRALKLTFQIKLGEAVLATGKTESLFLE